MTEATGISRGVVRRTAEMDWQPSPVAGVWRKRLELAGAVEAGRVTSVVRFDPGARFPRHAHPDGEEILVLDGVFSDETVGAMLLIMNAVNDALHRIGAAEVEMPATAEKVWRAIREAGG